MESKDLIGQDGYLLARHEREHFFVFVQWKEAHPARASVRQLKIGGACGPPCQSEHAGRLSTL